MNNLQADGWDFTDLKYVQLTGAELARWRLEHGDIVFNRTNSKALVGKCEVFDRNGAWVFASYLMRLRVDQEKALPEFVAAFLNTAAGRLQIDRESRQIIGMSNINAQEIRKLRIPLPKLGRQRELLTALERARTDRRRKLDEANALLGGTDRIVRDALGIGWPPSEVRRTSYAVRLADVVEEQKLYPDHFHPERLTAIHIVKRLFKGSSSAKLLAVADFPRDLRQVRPGDSYLGLANVQPNTGERIDGLEEVIEGVALEYRESDVLFARLRPYLNKVYLADGSGLCSPEFHVLRVKRGNDGKPLVVPAFLAAILRSTIVVAQTRHMMTGNTHPRVANEDVVNLVIPLPDPPIQEKIAAEVFNCSRRARQLRHEAQVAWEEAKRHFEEALLAPNGESRNVGTAA
jgi:type I restriction enzyme, S subunit